jgi:hypothetical protein
MLVCKGAVRAITPATIFTTPQNNFNPGSGTFIRLVTTSVQSDYEITGIANGFDGKMLIIRNTGIKAVG